MNYSVAVAYLLAAGTPIVPITTADNTHISNARHLRASKLNHEAHMMSLPIIAANLNIANDDDDDNINNSEQMKGDRVPIPQPIMIMMMTTILVLMMK